MFWLYPYLPAVSLTAAATGVAGVVIGLRSEWKRRKRLERNRPMATQTKTTCDRCGAAIPDADVPASRVAVGVFAVLPRHAAFVGGSVRYVPAYSPRSAKWQDAGKDRPGLPAVPTPTGPSHAELCGACFDYVALGVNSELQRLMNELRQAKRQPDAPASAS